MSGRVSYSLGLVGPCVPTNTACSSSLVAWHLAARGVAHVSARHAACSRSEWPLWKWSAEPPSACATASPLLRAGRLRDGNGIGRQLLAAAHGRHVSDDPSARAGAGWPLQGVWQRGRRLREGRGVCRGGAGACRRCQVPVGLPRRQRRQPGRAQQRVDRPPRAQPAGSDCGGHAGGWRCCSPVCGQPWNR